MTQCDLDAVAAVVTVEQLRLRRKGRVLEQPVSVVWRFQNFRCVEMWAHFDDQQACDAFWAGWSAEHHGYTRS
jgi:ketosteroid isomerase-like protein